MSSIYSDKSDQPVEIASSEPTGKEGELWGVDAPTEAWRTQYGSSTGRVWISDDGTQLLVYANERDLVLTRGGGIDHEIGTSYDLGGADFGEDRIFFAEELNDYFQGRNRYTDTRDWRANPNFGQAGDVAAVPADYAVAACGNSATAGVLNYADGTTEWSETFNANANAIDRVAGTNGITVFASGADNSVHARKPRDGAVMWDKTINNPVDMAVDSGYVFVLRTDTNYNPIVTALDQTDGSTVWEDNVTGAEYNIKAEDGVVVATLQENGAKVYDADTGTVLYHFNPFPKTHRIAIRDSETMFFGGGDEWFARFDLPGSSVSQYELKKGGSWDPAQH